MLRQLLYPVYRRLETSGCVLRYLFVEITQRCNLACLHCGSDCTSAPRAGELTTEEWLNFFTYLRRRLDRSRLLLVVTGGEPFCHPDFDRILQGLHAEGLAWGMVSNGWALSAENVAKVLAHGLAAITVSLDGLQESHDWLRGRSGSFARAVAGIELLGRAPVASFDVVTCANPRNLRELPQILHLLRGLGVKAWRLFSIFPRGRAQDNAGLRLSEAEIRHLVDWIAATRRDLQGRDFKVQWSCEGYLPAEVDRQVRDEPYFCRAGINIASVLCDGAISACPNIPRSLIQGNIRADDFVDVWENRFQALRDRSWMAQGACAACPEWRRCQGNSLHLWDEDRGAPATCHHAVLRPASDSNR